ncbi:DNRLRE domain-containing protein [Psychromonas sp.]|nr:DNRLRE domain-containing protein [Psychromonas sp.]
MRRYNSSVSLVGFALVCLSANAFGFGQSTLNASQDSFVYSGDSDASFATTTPILVKQSSSGNGDREAYYQFDLSGMTSLVQSAYFKVGVEDYYTSDIQVNYTDQSWSDDDINWNTRLLSTTELINFPATDNSDLRIDVRDLLNDYISKGKSNLTLIISSAEITTSSLKLASLESDEQAKKPQISYDTVASDYPFSFGIDYAWSEKGDFSGHTLDSVTGALETSKYGGWKNLNLGATGYFRTEKNDGAWTLVDPDGYVYISMGLNTVKDEGSLELPSAIQSFGINSLGSWSSEDIGGIAYTPRWNMLAKFINSEEELSSLYDDSLLVPVFYPGFADFVDDIAKDLAAYADDPYVLGHFSDNELNFHKTVQLSGSLALDEDNPLFIAANAWLIEKHGDDYSQSDITDDNELEYEGYIAEVYYKTVSEAIKRYAPNHLYLGSRLHSDAKSNPYIIKAAAKYVDVISINYYGRWEPDAEHLALWESVEAPFMVTEFYTKATDSGMENTDGAGWLVAEQRERSLFFENFALNLLASKANVGWHWFKYIDDDGANKGVFTESYLPYNELQTSMSQIAQMVYPLRSYLLDGTLDFNGLAIKETETGDEVDPIEEVTQPVEVVEPVGEVTEPVEVIEPVGEVTVPVEVIDPVEEVTEPVEVINPVEEVTDPDEVVEPVGEVTDPVEVIEPVGEVTVPVEVIDPVEEVTEPVIEVDGSQNAQSGSLSVFGLLAMLTLIIRRKLAVKQ